MQQYLGRHVSMGEMKALTHEDVKPIYKSMYADKVCFDKLPDGLNWAVLDWAVNSGTGRAAKALQKLVGARQDGAIGPKTLQAVMNHDPAELIDKLHDSRQKFYEGLSHFKTFGKGWTRRNQETREQSHKMAVVFNHPKRSFVVTKNPTRVFTICRNVSVLDKFP